MDVTNGLGDKLQAAVAQLPGELKPLFDGMVEEVSSLESKAMADAVALETKTAADLSLIAKAAEMNLGADTQAIVGELAKWRAMLQGVADRVTIAPPVSVANPQP